MRAGRAHAVVLAERDREETLVLRAVEVGSEGVTARRRRSFDRVGEARPTGARNPADRHRAVGPVRVPCNVEIALEPAEIEQHVVPGPAARAALGFFFDFARQAPDELNVDVAVVRVPDDTRFVHLEVCYSGSIAEGEKVIAPLRAIRKPINDTVQPQPYVKLQASNDETLAHGLRYYLKAGFVPRATPAFVDTVLGIIEAANLPQVQAVSIPQGGGAIARIRTGATAFAQRAADHNAFLFTRWTDPAMNEPVAAWIRAAYRALRSGRYPRVKAATWWHERWTNEDDRVSDVRIDSDRAATAAYRSAVSSPEVVDRPEYACAPKS